MRNGDKVTHGILNGPFTSAKLRVFDGNVAVRHGIERNAITQEALSERPLRAAGLYQNETYMTSFKGEYREYLS